MLQYLFSIKTNKIYKMSFSKYAIEKKQVSLDMGVPWQDVQPIEYLIADGVAASSSGWTDSYKMKVKIDPTNLGTPRGYLAHKSGCSDNEPQCSWTMLNYENEGVTSYYVNPTCDDLVELTPNEWKYIDIGVVDGATFAGFFC